MTIGTRHYPTPSNVTYYIDQWMVDDIYRVDFERRVSHQPIFGYDSRRFDFVAEGKEMVTGRIIVNFRYPGYLRNVLATVSQKQYENQKLLDGMIREPGDGFDYLDANKIVDFLGTTTSTTDRARTLSNYLLLQRITTELIPGQPRDLARGIHGDATRRNTSPATVSDVVQALKDNYRKRWEAVAGGNEDEELGKYDSPLDVPGVPKFDLIVKYDSGRDVGIFDRVFRDVVLVGEEEVVSAAAGGSADFSSSAQPILEMYPFFARTIKVINPHQHQS